MLSENQFVILSTLVTLTSDLSIYEANKLVSIWIGM